MLFARVNTPPFAVFCIIRYQFNQACHVIKLPIKVSEENAVYKRHETCLRVPSEMKHIIRLECLARRFHTKSPSSMTN